MLQGSSGLDVGYERKKAVMNPLWFLARATGKVELSLSEMGDFILQTQMGKE